MLIALSGALAGALALLHLPAVLLIGPMLAGIAVAVAGGGVAVPPLAGAVAQGAVGCLIAQTIDPSVLGAMLNRWPLLLSVAGMTIVAGAGLGWTISRLGIIRGSTPIWGMMPGAAPAMMLMADQFGADGRLVAFMQYVRVVLVAVVAACVSRIWLASQTHPSAPATPDDWTQFPVTLAVIAVGVVLGKASRQAAGIMLATLLIAATAHVGGVTTLALPPAFLGASYAVLGWVIGLRFTAPVLAAAARTLPQTMAAVAIMIGFCGLLATALVFGMRVDPLSAYLATSPGGMDAVAIVAASTHVDLPFVMALQLLRFLLILLVGPALARLAARATGG